METSVSVAQMQSKNITKMICMKKCKSYGSFFSLFCILSSEEIAVLAVLLAVESPVGFFLKGNFTTKIDIYFKSCKKKHFLSVKNE